jgi:hypothetical protein
MEWIVNIEGGKNERIKVRFNPKSEEVVFIGQYKPHNKEWTDFSEEIYSMEIDLETIQRLLAKTIKTMRERLKAYKNIAEGFEYIKLIAIKEEE